MRAARTAFVVLGALLVAVGAAALVVGVPVGQWPAILVWLVAAVLLHDAVFAPLVLIGTRLLRRTGARTSWARLAIVQVALVVGAALSLVAFPGIRAQELGARNPSVLVFPYALHLALLWGGIAVVTAAAVLLTRPRRRLVGDASR
ncbi:hypothetical protein [Amnibacterium kyonggiense]